uniref:Uncharacterized protein n=1 Tax=Romanomermis culicivorax TaxID=13658 RepID=A0A915KQ30_ROMCU
MISDLIKETKATIMLRKNSTPQTLIKQLKHTSGFSTFIPADLHFATASGTAALGGSIKDIRPTN